MGMTYKEAAEFAGCSIGTLKRYQCKWCDQTMLAALTRGCGAIYEKCEPREKSCFPWRGMRKQKQESEE